MDLIDEEHVALFEVGEERREVAGLGDDRTRRGAEIHAQLARDDLRQRGLAEPGRPDEQDMIERLVARPRRLDEHREVFPRLLLADEFRKLLRAQRRFRGVFIAALRGHELASGGAVHPSSPRLYLFGNSALIGTAAGDFAVRHDHPRFRIVVENQLAAGATRRHHGDGLILMLRRRMPHRNDCVDPRIAEIDDGAAERHRLGTDRHAAEIGIEIDAGKNLSLSACATPRRPPASRRDNAV